ncbi:alpha-xylosidase [Belliella sp. DSM 111904]|uniref:Alpha-xylosidase n=1 Tax=Belliella filtrata TaxID=2923435 RepID=A0ABS9UVC3_9BACT|nr:alpha-xylosidase [Belliella filtrata]MCH7408116.1 alpha-xylosidase [Belliella filtrata]
MNRTNYQLFDFLDFDPNLKPEEQPKRLWRAGKPVDIATVDGIVVVTIAFQCQEATKEIHADTAIPLEFKRLSLEALGDKILRVGIGEGKDAFPDSDMLEFALDLERNPLSVTKSDKEWNVVDSRGKLRAKFSFEDHPKDHWSELLPEPQETLEMSFYPGGEKEVKMHGFDQFFPARQDAFGLAYIKEGGLTQAMTISLHAKPDEKFVGTGERFAKMDLAGKTFQMKNQDGQGVNSQRTYKNVPFYLSSELYGMFLHTSAYCKFSMADHSTRSVQVLSEEPSLDIFLIGGDKPEEILYQYRRITGFPSVPPLWSFGIWMSKMTYFSAEEVYEICDRLRQEDYPCDVIHLDTGWFKTDWLCEWEFNPERFPDPAGFMQRLRKDGYKVSLWQMPYIAKEAAQHDEAKENNFFGESLKVSKQEGSNFSALDYAGTIDFTYPKAVAWYKNLLRNLLETGAVCIKTDFGEEIHMDASYHRMNAKQLNNIYGLLYQKAAFEVTKEVTGEGIVWARAGWAGCQRYPLHWGGDAAATWDGLAGSLRGGLHLGLSGFAFWSHDVPGFHALPDFMNSIIPDELYARWTQFGVFSSHIRYHGTSKREPYHYPKIADMVRRWWKLRYALIPYIMKESVQSTLTGYPVLRAMLFHDFDDPTVWHLDDQYYFGADFLVAPIMNDLGNRKVYLPKGDWVDFFTGEKLQGKQWLDRTWPLEEMPVWVKLGASLPIYSQPVTSTDEMNLEQQEMLFIDQDYKGIWKFLGI